MRCAAVHAELQLALKMAQRHTMGACTAAVKRDRAVLCEATLGCLQSCKSAWGMTARAMAHGVVAAQDDMPRKKVRLDTRGKALGDVLPAPKNNAASLGALGAGGSTVRSFLPCRMHAVAGRLSFQKLAHGAVEACMLLHN